MLACKAKTGPHVFAGGHEEIAWLAAGGYIVPLDDYIAEYYEQYELGDIYDGLWDACKWKGKIWCFPQDTEARPVYFRKDILRAIGWSEEEIEALPEKVKRGEFTLDDMIEVAKQAMAAGVSSVDGFPLEWGIYHRPSPGGELHMIYLDYGGILQDPETGKLVLDKDAMLKALQFYYNITQVAKVTPPGMTTTSWRSIHKAVVEGRVLFWFGGTWHWAEWQRVAYHEKLGGLPEEYEWENIGFMLVPAAEKGGRPMTLSHPFTYMVTSDKCYPTPEGYTYDPVIGFRWVANTNRLELVTKHALGSAHLSPRRTVSPEYAAWKFGAAVTYMLDYTTTLPNHEKWSVYHRAVYDAIVAVETGEKTPEEALAWLEGELTRELGDELIVR